MMRFTSEPPSKRQLKQHFIDLNRGLFPAATLNCVAHQILSIEDPEEVMRIGLEFLAEELSAPRADGGFATPRDRVYRPSAVCNRGPESHAGLEGIAFSNNLQIFREAWKRDVPVVCNDVASSPLLADAREQFKAIGSRSVLMQRLSLGGRPVGLACIDFTHDEHLWSSDEIRTMNRFCSVFLGPLVGISRHWRDPGAVCATRKPSDSELEVIRHAARGSSYKQIAHALGKSVRTIENQLRSARNKVGAANQAELIGKCAFWI